MATVKPPEKFNFDKPEQWAQWSQRFKRFRTVTKLDKEKGELQVDSLIYIMGEDAEIIFRNMMFKREDGTSGLLTTDEKKNFDCVMTAFSQYFQPRVNYLDHQIEFSKRMQKQEEPVENFIRALYEMSEHCNFPNREDMIKNKIITGVKNKQLERDLRLKGDELTLDMAVTMARNWEEVEKHVHLETCEVPKQLDAIKRRQQHTRDMFQKGKYYKNDTRQFKPKNSWNQQKCDRCGLSHHKETNCPAKGKKCMKCGKYNHFQAVCRTKINKVKDLTSNEPPEYFLGSIQCKSDYSPWTVTLPICQKDVQLKIDSGADVTVITNNTYQSLIDPPQLKSTKNVLRSLTEKVDCDGWFETETHWNGKLYKFPVYVIKKGSNLLSRSVSSAMNILEYRGDNVINDINIDPDVFQDIGLRPGDQVKVRLDSDKDWSNKGVVKSVAGTRSYNVQNEKGNEVRRNRRHIQFVPRLVESDNNQDSLPQNSSQPDNMDDMDKSQVQKQVSTVKDNQTRKPDLIKPVRQSTRIRKPVERLIENI